MVFGGGSGGFDLGTAFGKIVIDGSDVDSGIQKVSKSISGGLQDIGQSLTSVGLNLTALGAPFLAFGATAVGAFEKSQDALAQLDAVLKSTTAHNGEFATTVAGSADDIDKANQAYQRAADRLRDMQTLYDSNEKHTTAQTLALQNQKDKVAGLEAELGKLNATTTTQINVTHMDRDELVNMSKRLQEQTRYSDEAVLSAESMLLTFTNIGSDVFPYATSAVLDMSTALGQDLKSSSIQLGKALQDPINGLTALKRVGVNFTQSQKDMVKAMVNSGNIMGAQKLILKELQTEFGGSAVAAGQTFAGQVDILRNRFDDLQESIGEKIIPVLETLMDFIGQLITGFENLDPSTQQTIINIGLLFAALAVIGPVIAAIGIGLSAIGGVLAFLLSPLGLIIVALTALGVAFATNFGGIQDTLRPILNWLQTNFGDVWGALWAGVPPAQIMSGLLYRLLPPETAESIKNGLNDIKTKLEDTWKSIQTWIDKHPDFVVAVALIGIAVIGLALLMGGFAVAVGLVTTAWGLLMAALSSILLPIALLVIAVGALLYLIAEKYPGGLAGLLRDAAKAAQELAAISLKTFLDTINEAVKTLTTIWNIIELIKTGQITPGQLLGAVGSEISNNAGGNNVGMSGLAGPSLDPWRQQAAALATATNIPPSAVQPIPPPGGGSSLGQGLSAGLVHNGDVHINASDYAGGQAAAKGWSDKLDEIYKSRGN